jgi:16S rRNA processing protein RimM
LSSVLPPKNLVQLGYIAKTHGYKGACVVRGHSGKDSALGSVSSLFVGPTPDACEKFDVEESSWMPSGWKIKLKGLDDEKIIKQKCGQLIFVDRQSLPAIEAHQYYVSDLMGATVLDTSGKVVGKLVGIESLSEESSVAGVHDNWIVEIEKGHKVSVPASVTYISKVDMEKREVWVNNFSKLL